MSLSHEPAKLSGMLYLDGHYLKSAATTHLDVIDPATEEKIAEIADTPGAEIEQAITVANHAQKNWHVIDSRSRATLLHEIAARIRRDKERYAYFITREEGKPFKESVDEASWCATALDYYAEIARHEAGKIAGTTVPGQFHFVVKEPLGTVVIILPFNFPLVLLCWELAAAIAAGNAVIVKPHEQTSITTLKFMEVFADLPNGLVQVITGGPRVAQHLVKSKDTHCVAYTGSIPIAQEIMKSCAERLKPALIEASGNDPFIIMPSAPLDIAVRGAAFSAYLNCGQVCTAAERFYVHESIHDEFVNRLLVETEKLRIGNGLHNVDIGPMATSRQRQRFETLLSHAKEQGATFICGGKRPTGLERGWFVQPTILTDVAADSEIMTNEAFGPVVPICRVKSFDEALELANNSEFGLGANLYSCNMQETMQAVETIQSGILWINAPLLDNDALPFGGRKLSGIGRQLGAEGLAQFQTSKFVMLDPCASSQDFWWFPYSQTESYDPAKIK